MDGGIDFIQALNNRLNILSINQQNILDTIGSWEEMSEAYMGD